MTPSTPAPPPAPPPIVGGPFYGRIFGAVLVGSGVSGLAGRDWLNGAVLVVIGVLVMTLFVLVERRQRRRYTDAVVDWLEAEFLPRRLATYRRNLDRRPGVPPND